MLTAPENGIPKTAARPVFMVFGYCYPSLAHQDLCQSNTIGLERILT